METNCNKQNKNKTEKKSQGQTTLVHAFEQCETKEMRSVFYYLFRIVGDVEIGINEEDVLRFQVRMGQFIVVKESHSVGELVTDMSDLLQRVRLVIVIFLQRPKILH